MNTAGKVSNFMPIMEEIEIYFTDEWGDVVTDKIDFQNILTFDYALPDLSFSRSWYYNYCKIRLREMECEKNNDNLKRF